MLQALPPLKPVQLLIFPKAPLEVKVIVVAPAVPARPSAKALASIIVRSIEFILRGEFVLYNAIPMPINIFQMVMKNPLCRDGVVCKKFRHSIT
jgi:hypothetical protein